MATLLIVCSNKKYFSAFASELKDHDAAQVSWATSSSGALAAVKESAVDLVIIEEIVDDMTGLEFVRKLVAVNPLINCALASGLSAEDFHEATEGLGVLMQLPTTPSKEDAQRLLEHVKKIMGLLN